jgi:TP901 family phage tail tape measure protein
MATLGEVLVKVGVDMRDFETKMQSVHRQFGRLGSKVQEIGTQMGTAFTVAGAGIAVGLGYAVAKAADFEQSLANIAAVAPEASGHMDQIKAKALEMGAKTKYSATEAAQGMLELIKAGVSLEDVLSGGIEGALNLATAGELDLAEAAEIASTALNAFKKDGLSVADAADILAGAANASATDVREMKYGLSQASAVASGAGMTFRDTATALALFAQSGLKGSDAGTSLKTMLMNLQPATKAQKEVFQELGLVTEQGTSAFFKANGELKSLADIAGLLHEKLSGYTRAQRLAKLEAIGGSDAVRALNILYEAGADGVEKMNKAMSKTTAAEVAKAKMDTLKGSLERLRGSFETAATSIGDALAPHVRKLADGLTVIVDKFNALPGPVKQFVAVAAALTAILLILAGIAGFAAAGFGALAAAEWAAIAPILAIAGIVAVAIAAIVAIGAALVAAYNRFAWFRNIVNTVWNAIKAGLMALWAFIQPAIQAVVAFFISQWERVKAWWMTTWPMLQQAFVNIWNFIAAFIGPIISAIVAIFMWAWPFVQSLIIGVWNNVKAVISGALDFIMALITAFAALFTGNWSKLWESVKTMLRAALQVAWNLFQLFFLGKILKGVSVFGGRFVSFLGKYLGQAWQWVSRIFGQIWSKVSSVFGRVVSKAKSAWNQVTSTIRSELNEAKSAVKSVVDWILSKLSGLGSKALQYGKNLVSMFADGIRAGIGWVKNAATSVMNKVKSIMGFSSPTEEGPASNSDHWAPNFVDMFAEGLRKGAPLIRSAARVAAGTLSDEIGIPKTLKVSHASQGGLSQVGNEFTQPLEIKVMLDGRQIMPTIRDELRIDLIKATGGVR